MFKIVDEDLAGSSNGRVPTGLKAESGFSKLLTGEDVKKLNWPINSRTWCHYQNARTPSRQTPFPHHLMSQ